MRPLAGILLVGSLGLIGVNLACNLQDQRATRLARSLPSPTSPAPTPDPKPATTPWEGTLTVESLENEVPECVAEVWGRGSTHTISADVNAASKSIEVILYQQPTNGCQLKGTVFSNQIDARAWLVDEFDCAMVPSLCGIGCHFRVQTSGWSCAAPVPEIWITNANLHATVDPVVNRIEGVATIQYAHSMPKSARWSDLQVTARIELRKTN